MQRRDTESKNYGRQFFSGVAILTLATFIVKIIGVLYKIPMMKYLGAEGMGYFNSAYEIYSLLFVISTTGIPVALSILVSQNREIGKYENADKIFKISVFTLGVIGSVGTLIMAVFHKELASFINNDASLYCILAISPALLMICLSGAVRGYFQGCQRMAPTAISQVIEALCKLVLGLGFAMTAIKKGYDSAHAAAFAVLGISIGTALSFLYLILHKLTIGKKYDLPALDVRKDKTRVILKQLLCIAVPITLSSTILSLTKIIDMTMILRRLGDIGYTQEEANAIYGSYSTMAVSIFNLPSTIVSAIALPLVPMLAAAIEVNDSTKERSVISSSFKLTSLISFPIGLGMSVFSRQILELLFLSQSEEIEYTAPLLSLLGLSVLLSSMITVTNAILQAYKEVKKPIISMLVGTLVKIVASFILIGDPRVNIYGAPISTFFSTLAVVALNLYFILRSCKKTDSVLNIFVKPFVASLLSVTVGVGLYLLLDGAIGEKLATVTVILAVALLYAFTVIRVGAINKNEIITLPGGEKIIKILEGIHWI